MSQDQTSHGLKVRVKESYAVSGLNHSSAGDNPLSLFERETLRYLKDHKRQLKNLFKELENQSVKGLNCAPQNLYVEAVAHACGVSYLRG